MTTQLIPVFSGEIAGFPVQLVDARLLHSFLEVSTKFSDWITRRVEEYGFTQDTDFISTVLKVGKRSNVNQIDYHISIDMAKDLANLNGNKPSAACMVSCIQSAIDMILKDINYRKDKESDSATAARLLAAVAVRLEGHA